LVYQWKFAMKDHVSSHVHSSWLPIFEPIANPLENILESVAKDDIAPSYKDIFRAFEFDLEKIRCVIVGQDPYPTQGNAMGLAFSVPSNVQRIPATLKNIFLEREADLAIPAPKNGDLTRWAESGVLLLNRVLTTRIGESNAHTRLGWQLITDHIASEVGKRDVVAILWGRQAQELKPYFSHTVESVHPSPLSAYRGFFGSRPFSKVNEILIEKDYEPLDWLLQEETPAS
jgi:uracil-DNA glycosylase